MCRFNEFRRVGWGGKRSVYLSMYGTEGCYEEHAGSSSWTSIQRGHVEDVSALLDCGQSIPVPNEEKHLHEALQDDFFTGVSPIHPVSRLPKTFAGLKNGHFGSHHFLVDDFVKACVTGKQPPNHAWAAARYCIPGLIAHESALREGEMLPIPDLGDMPSSFELLDLDTILTDE